MNRREFTKSALMLGVMAQTPFGDAEVKAAPAEPADSAPSRSIDSSPQIAFARAEIKRSGDSSKSPPVEFSIDPNRLKPQCYRIEREGGKINVIGGDANGAMYGGLDVAEAIRLDTLTELKFGEHRPYIEHRGIKFNITPDRRTPTYSDNSDSAQLNIPQMWSLDFWQE